jgi:hypothetical protein
LLSGSCATYRTLAEKARIPGLGSFIVLVLVLVLESSASFAQMVRYLPKLDLRVFITLGETHAVDDDDEDD